MTIERNVYGCWVLSDMVGEGPEAYLFTRRYMGYSERDAVAEFRREWRLAALALWHGAA